MYISFWRGHAARRGDSDGLFPWVVDSLLSLAGYESAGDLVDLLAGGAGAAVADATVDAVAAAACDVLMALAFCLFLDGAPIGTGGAQALALLVKLAGTRWPALATSVLGAPLVIRCAPGDTIAAPGPERGEGPDVDPFGGPPMRQFLIDTDTASDDAVALVMALRAPDVRVEAITVVSGNVPLAQATENALYTAEMCGAADVPVFAGADRPLVREPAHAQWFHGDDGFGNRRYPPAKIRSRPGHAADAIVRIVHANPGIELVTLGPLTNVALALRADPSIAGEVERCVVMGGNPCCEGNVTPAAEYNIWCDPEAARDVLRSGMNVELIGWHLCRGDANLSASDIARVRRLDTPLAHFAIDINRVAMESNRTQCGEEGIPLPDPVAMAVALDPSISTQSSRHRVDVECASELTRGMTVVDRLNVSGDERNRGVWDAAGGAADVLWAIDVPRWKALLYRALSA